MRLQQLFKVIKYNKPTTIVEVGTYNAYSALHLITWACRYAPEGTTVKYYGFDLFEDATPEIDEQELNAKHDHGSLLQVAHTIQSYKDKEGLNFEFELIKGNSRDTLHKDGPWKTADFAFIDGGHSLETIESDYNALRNCKVIAFDDVYLPDDDGKCVDTTKFGANILLDKLPTAVILPLKDPVLGGGCVSIGLTPANANPYPVSFQVKTRNCVDNTEIHSNIEYATRKDRRFIPICTVNERTAVIVAAGPSYLDDLDEIKTLSETDGNVVFCVKSNYNKMVSSGVNLHGVVLLDPRSHVSDFIHELHDGLFYYVSTMCHPSTVDRVGDMPRAIFWNALVGAEEDKYIAKLIEDEKRNIDPYLLRGGSTAAMRTITVAYTLGFRRFILYGFDSCFWTPQDMNHVDALGQPYFWNVAVNNKPYLTCLQLYSQAQEFGMLLESIGQQHNFDIEVRGRGIIKDIYDKHYIPRPSFESFVNG